MNISGLDTTIFPHLASYLNGLPNGLNSYPEARTRSVFNILLRNRMHEALEHRKLPAALKQRLTENWSTDAWIPTTIYGALSALARDLIWRSDSQYHQGMFEVSQEMFGSMLYRAMMYVISPSLAIMGISKRFHTFHEGTALMLQKQDKTSADLLLSYPENLFTKTTLDSMGAVICAGLSGSRGKDPQASFIVVDSRSAKYHINWTF